MILYRHISREFIKPFFYSLSTIMMLFMMQLLTKLLPLVLQKGISGGVIAELFAVNLVHIAVLSVPMSMLLAMLMVFGKLAANNELTAIKAGGHSIVSMLPPVIALSGFVGVIMLFFNTTVLPEANHHASVLRADIMRKKPAALIEPKVLIKDFPGYALLVDSVEADSGKIFGIKIFSEGEGNKPTVTVAEWGTIFMTSDEENIELTLFNGETHTPGNDGTNEHYLIHFEEQVVYFDNIDSDLNRSDRESRGDREKTNAQLLEDVANFEETRNTYVAQHETRVDELLRFIDTLMIVELPEPDLVPEVDSAVALEINSEMSELFGDSLLEIDSSLLSVNSIVVSEIENDLPISQSDSLQETDSSPPEQILESQDEETVDEHLAYREILANIEQQGSGRQSSHIIRGEVTRARIRSTRIERETEKINSSLVEVHKKYALAVAVIVFALLGVPLGAISRSGSVAISVVYSLAFFIIYYAFLVVGEKISENYGVSPALAMWIGNIVLSILAVYLIARVVRESSFVNWGNTRAWFRRWKHILSYLIVLIIGGGLSVFLFRYVKNTEFENDFIKSILHIVKYGILIVAMLYPITGLAQSRKRKKELQEHEKREKQLSIAEHNAELPIIEVEKKPNPVGKFFKALWKGIKAIVFFPGAVVKFILPTLPGYILGRFFSFFFTVMLGLIVLTVVIDYVSMIAKLDGALPGELVEYYFYFIAGFMTVLLPISLLLATMLSIGSFARTNELTAIKAAGISMVKMTIPFLVVGLLFSVGIFYFSETVLPEANPKRNHLKAVFNARRNNQPIPESSKVYKHDFYYFSDPTTAYRFTHFQTSPARGDNIMRYRFGDGTLIQTTQITKMVYEDSVWIMLDGIHRDFVENSYEADRFFREIDPYITDTPDEMVRGVGIVDELSHTELQEITEKARQRGEDVSRYEADLNFKFALPLMNFIVILIGVAVTARSDKRGGAVHFGVGLLFVAIYWAVSQLFLVFGRSGQLDALFAAWSGTVLFLVIGLLMYRKASQ